MKKIKVLFSIDSLNAGGAEKVLINVIKNLDRSKFKISVCTVFNQGYYLGFLPNDVHYDSLFNVSNQFGVISKLIRYLSLAMYSIFPFLLIKSQRLKNDHDMIISFCEGYNTIFFQNTSTNLSKSKKFLSWVHIDFRKHKPIPFLTKLYASFKSYDEVVFVSNDARSGFVETINNNDHTHVLYNPIDWEEVLSQSKNSVSLPSIMKDSTDKLKLIAVGRLQYQKRFDRLIDAMSILKSKGYSFTLNILGEGDLGGDLIEKIKSKSLENDCLLRGFQSNVPAWIQASDIFVMSSDYEGLPLVICEAMILSKPIVSTDITGPRELLNNGEFGLLCDINTESLAQVIESFMKDELLRIRYQSKLSENKEKFIFKKNIADIQQFIIDNHERL